MVHDLGGDQPATRLAQPAQRVGTQEGRAHSTPRSRLVEADLSIETPSCTPVVPMLLGTVRVAVARCGHYRPATRLPAGSGGTQRHSHLSGGEDLAS
jgi:hypothetical protein